MNFGKIHVAHIIGRIVVANLTSGPEAQSVFTVISSYLLVLMGWCGLPINTFDLDSLAILDRPGEWYCIASESCSRERSRVTDCLGAIDSGTISKL